MIKGRKGLYIQLGKQLSGYELSFQSELAGQFNNQSFKTLIYLKRIFIMTIKLSIFPSLTQTHGATTDLEWSQLIEKFSKHDVREQKDGEMFSPSLYANDIVRNDIGVTGFNCMALDFDNTIGTGKNAAPSKEQSHPEDHIDNLGEFSALWYSTHNNTKDWCKWRLIIPFTREVTPDEWTSVWHGALNLLADDNNIDRSCKDLSRAYWFPSCQEKHKDAAFYGSKEGELVDPDYLISLADNDRIIVSNNNVAAPAYEHQERQGRNDQLRAMVSGMQSDGQPFEYIVSKIMDYDQKKHAPPLFEDPDEPFNATPWLNAMRFTANIIYSHGSKQKKTGKPVEEPTFRNEPIRLTTLPQRIKAETPYYEHKNIDPRLLNPPGLLGEWTNWINETARKPQPIWALGAAITGFGTIMGRRVKSWSGLRTNFYIANIGEAGAGKEHPQACSISIFNSVQNGEDFLMGQEVSSDSAILDKLQEFPTRFMISDEFGLWIQVVAGERTGYHLANIPKWLNNIFTRANSTVYGKDYSAGANRNKQSINCPNLSILGSSTPDQFYGALNKNSISSGFIPRWLLFETDQHSPLPIKPDLSSEDGPPTKLIEELNARLAMTLNTAPKGNLDVSNKPFIVGATPEAEKMFDELEVWQIRESDKFRGTGLNSLFLRTNEHAIKLALVCASGLSINPVIDEECATWAIGVAKWSLNNFVAAAIDRIYENKFEKLTKDIYRFVKSGADQRRTKSEITRHTQGTKSYDRDEVIKNLIEIGSIEMEIVKTGGANATIYHAVHQ